VPGPGPIEQAIRITPRLIESMWLEMRTIHTTESGQRFIGAICKNSPWIYWNTAADFVKCERCGTEETMPYFPGRPSEVVVTIVANRLAPFERDHRKCERRPS
jgi:hypothetical protein